MGAIRDKMKADLELRRYAETTKTESEKLSLRLMRPRGCSSGAVRRGATGTRPRMREMPSDRRQLFLPVAAPFEPIRSARRTRSISNRDAPHPARVPFDPPSALLDRSLGSALTAARRHDDDGRRQEPGQANARVPVVLVVDDLARPNSWPVPPVDTIEAMRTTARIRCQELNKSFGRPMFKPASLFNSAVAEQEVRTIAQEPTQAGMCDHTGWWLFHGHPQDLGVRRKGAIITHELRGSASTYVRLPMGDA